ncbi:MAG: dTMP kinase [Pirellulales bacterium]
MTSFFVSLDGIDGCGKSTQIALLKQWLENQGHSVLLVRDPGGTKLGESLREILLHRKEIPLASTAEMLLYMASRAQLVRECIEPALAEGRVVISDRYLLANVVYQSCAGVPAESIWQVGSIATGGREPDLTFVLDLDPAIAYGRMEGEHDRLESRGLDYMRAVRDGFLNQSKQLGNKVKVIDANQSIEAIQDQIAAELSVRLLS